MRLKLAERFKPLGLDAYDARNVYYYPENYGLRKVAELEYSDGDYQFDTRVVWQDKEGLLWTARDNGCSCPAPFEDTQELERCFVYDLRDEYVGELRDAYPGLHVPSQQEWETFIEAVKASLAATGA